MLLRGKYVVRVVKTQRHFPAARLRTHTINDAVDEWLNVLPVSLAIIVGIRQRDALSVQAQQDVHERGDISEVGSPVSVEVTE